MSVRKHLVFEVQPDKVLYIFICEITLKSLSVFSCD